MSNIVNWSIDDQLMSHIYWYIEYRNLVDENIWKVTSIDPQLIDFYITINIWVIKDDLLINFFFYEMSL